MIRPGTRTRTSFRVATGALALVAALGTLAAPSVHAGQPLPHAARVAQMGSEQSSAAVRHVANWAVDSGDHGGRPFLIVDKMDSRVFVFDADGRLRGASAALIGSARGDQSVPGIGERKISSILPEERTTPAGRFTATMGLGPKGEDILWVDYDSGLALHRVVTGVPAERRLQRLQSRVAEDRRITYGCINVPVAFYESVVRPAFSTTQGTVYILPELSAPNDVFGSYEVRNPVAMQPDLVRTSH